MLTAMFNSDFFIRVSPEELFSFIRVSTLLLNQPPGRQSLAVSGGIMEKKWRYQAGAIISSNM